MTSILKKFNIAQKSIALIIIVLLLDQILKIWVKTHMQVGDAIPILGNRFYIHFLENEGMAFGYKLGGGTGKVLLTLFRIVAATLIALYLRTLIIKKAHPGLILSISLIFIGATGNIIDSMFYGILFGHSNGQIATFLPEGGGYASFLKGSVVDMIYCPIFRGHYPEWFPFKGGMSFEFFRPIFNIADSCITIGVFIILFFQKRFFAEKAEE